MMTRAEIQFIRSLADRKERIRSGLFVAEGRKLIEEIAASEMDVEKIYARADAPELPGCVSDRFTVSAKEMERISRLKTPSSVLALVRMPEYPLRADRLRGKLTLALDKVQDPGNVGTIIRLAEWFGIEDIVCSPDTADCYAPKVVQATMGGITRVRVHYADLPEFLRRAQAESIPVYGTFLEGEDVYESGLSPDGIVVMGSEGRGIGPETERLIGRKIRIPSFRKGRPGTESLNVAVAAAVICSEFRRRKP